MNPSSAVAHARTAGCAHDHLVEFYETTAFLVGTVADFLVPALRQGDAAIVVATHEHRAAFAVAIAAEGIDLDQATREGRYVALDAADLLSAFMVGGAPDPVRFAATAGPLIDRCASGGRDVRVYGEMVALLWADGDVASTIALEDLWNDLADARHFSLLCAYPLQDFDDAARAQFKQICAQHSSIIQADSRPVDTTGDEQLRLIAELRQETAALRAELRDLRGDAAAQ